MNQKNLEINILESILELMNFQFSGWFNSTLYYKPKIHSIRESFLLYGESIKLLERIGNLKNTILNINELRDSIQGILSGLEENEKTLLSEKSRLLLKSNLELLKILEVEYKIVHPEYQITKSKNNYFWLILFLGVILGIYSIKKFEKLSQK